MRFKFVFFNLDAAFCLYLFCLSVLKVVAAKLLGSCKYERLVNIAHVPGNL